MHRLTARREAAARQALVRAVRPQVGDGGAERARQLGGARCGAAPMPWGRGSRFDETMRFDFIGLFLNIGHG